MIALTIVCVLLALLVIALLLFLNKRTQEKAHWEHQEKRAWYLKTALEKTFKLPAVEEEEMAKLEPQLDQLMGGNMNDADVEEKMRQMIMSLYEEKQRARAPREAPPQENPPRRPNITGRGQPNR